MEGPESVEEAHRTPWARRLALLPVAMIAAGTALDFAIPNGVSTGPLLAAAPPTAAAVLSFRQSVAVAVASVLAGLALTVYHLAVGREHTYWILASVTLVAVVSVFLGRARRDRESELASLRTVAGAAQRAVLPVPPSRVGAVQVAVRYEAADAEANIGGDLYAVQETPFGIRLIIGDVRGKGMGAVGAVALLLGAFREAADLAPDLPDLVRRLDHALAREGARRIRNRDEELDAIEGFTTAVIGEVTRDGSRLRLVNRGHPAPLLLEPHGKVRELSPIEPDVPLGTSVLVPGEIHLESCVFPPGCQLLLFTDGVTEARDAGGRFYDPVVRLSGRTFNGPEHLVDAVLADVLRHTGGANTDDCALVALQRATG